MPSSFCDFCGKEIKVVDSRTNDIKYLFCQDCQLTVDKINQPEIPKKLYNVQIYLSMLKAPYAVFGLSLNSAIDLLHNCFKQGISADLIYNGEKIAGSIS